jgi:hypothetical protein
MKLIARRIVDKQILHVIKQWLSCGYIEDGQHIESKRGTPGLSCDYQAYSLSVPYTRVTGKPYEGKPHVRFNEGSIG